MSLQFIEGFDIYGNVSELAPGKWDVFTNNGGISFDTGRLGVNKCLKIASNSTSIEKNTSSNTASFVHALAIKMSASASAEKLIEYYDATTLQFYLSISATNYLEARDSAGTLLGTASSPLVNGVWYYFETKCVINGSTGSVEFKLDNSTVLTLTNVDTQASANSYITKYKIYGNTSEISYDDMYFLDLTGTANNDYLGDSRVDPFKPNADNSIAWTAFNGGTNFSEVDDTTPDDDTTYVYSSTSAATDLYDFEDMPSGTGDVYGVQVVGRARKLDAGTRQIKLKVKSGVTTQDSSNINLSTTYINYPTMFEDSDGAGTAWTKTLVDAAQIGVEVV